MKKILKNKKIFVLGFILGALIFGTTGVLAVTYYASKDVTYDNTESGMTSENVQDAIDELYGLATALDVGGSKIPTVTSGDGLYVDGYEDNVYTYRGSNPNNYVTFNGESWRIISANTEDNTIKIMRNTLLEDRAYDTDSNGRYNSGQYCSNRYFGCNIYGSTSSLYNSSGNAISTLARQVNGTKYALPSKESVMSTYLNGTYYNSLNATARSMVKQDARYKAGIPSHASGVTTAQTVTQVSSVLWQGKVALIDASEYLRASTNSGSCTGIYSSYQSGHPCATNNWLHISDAYWTMSPYSNSESTDVWTVYGNGYLSSYDANYARGVRPVVTLSSNIQITGGAGTSSDPYTLGV